MPKTDNHVNKSYLLSLVLFNTPMYPKYADGVINNTSKGPELEFIPPTLFRTIIKLVLEILKTILKGFRNLNSGRRGPAIQA